MAVPQKFTIAQIREDVFRQYMAKLPRVGLEMESFVDSQREYFGLDDRQCRKIIGDAQHAYEAQFRGGIQTATQKIADAMGFTRVEIIDTIRESMRATKKRAVLDDDGKPLKGEDGEFVYVETPDHANRIAAADKAAKLLGAYAPKEVHVEARHEHNVTISDDQLIAEFAAIAKGIGLKVVDAEFVALTGDAGADARSSAQVQIAAGRE